MNIADLFSDFSGAYFFSACLQANASIIALIGVFWIFKIQSINSNIEIIKVSLSMERGISTNIEVDPAIITIFETKTSNEQKEYIEKNIKDDSVKSLLESWMKNDIIKSEIMKSIKTPTIIISIGLFVDALFLAFSNLIHSFCTTIELIIISVALIYQFLIIYKVVENVLKTNGAKK